MNASTEVAGKRILVIDDDEDNRTLVKLALEINSDWKVFAAANGIQGIIQAELAKPDAILLDLTMPDLDGLTVCEILKSNLFTCTIPIIFMTAITQKETFAQLKNTLAQGIIVKPFNTLGLRSLIAKICNWQ